MRAWAEVDEALTAADAFVVSLTSEPPEVVRAAVDKEGFTVPIASVDPSLWAEWGVVNPARPNLPHPGTVVIDPDGVVLYRSTHDNFKERDDVRAVVQLVTDARARAPTEAEPEPEPEPPPGPDWDHALTIGAVGAPRGATLVLEVAEGFHVYGRRERSSQPLAVEVHGGGRAKIPKGEPKPILDTTSWVLSGRIELPIRARSDGAVSGTLRYQVCTDSNCDRPTSAAWSTR